MPPRPEAFETLNIEIPEYTGGESHPFSRGQDPKFYQTIKDTVEGKTARTYSSKEFGGAVLGLRSTGALCVSYQGRRRPRSLDAGCVKFLCNRRVPELELVYGEEGYIVAVKPLSRLLERFRPAYNSATAPYAVLATTLNLPFDISSPVDERRRVLSEQVRRDGAAGIPSRCMSCLGQSMRYFACRRQPGLGGGAYFSLSWDRNQRSKERNSVEV